MFAPNDHYILAPLAVIILLYIWLDWPNIRAWLVQRGIMSRPPAAPSQQPVHGASAEPVRHAEPPAAVPAQHDVTEPSDVIALLARLTDPATGRPYSGNKIAAFVGGTRADVLKKVSAARNADRAAPDTDAVRAGTRAADQIVEVLTDGTPVRDDGWGNYYVVRGSQRIPLDLYQPSEVA